MRGCAHRVQDLLPSQRFQKLVVSEGSQGEIWQDGDQVIQQAAVGCHEVGSHHHNRVRRWELIVTGVWGGGRAAGVCVTLAWKTHQWMAN